MNTAVVVPLFIFLFILMIPVFLILAYVLSYDEIEPETLPDVDSPLEYIIPAGTKLEVWSTGDIKQEGYHIVNYIEILSSETGLAGKTYSYTSESEMKLKFSKEPSYIKKFNISSIVADITYNDYNYITLKSESTIEMKSNGVLLPEPNSYDVASQTVNVNFFSDPNFTLSETPATIFITYVVIPEEEEE